MSLPQQPEVLWTPAPERVAASRLTAFAGLVAQRTGTSYDDYEALWQWSVDEVEEFWRLVWEFFRVGPPVTGPVLTSRDMPGARWFQGVNVNFAERVLSAGEGAATALVCVGEEGLTAELTWDELRAQVSALAASLQRLGVQRGERVVAYVPNGPEAIVAMLATASLGAVWSTCAPDIGQASATDRFGQLSPVLLITADGYRYGGKPRDRRDAVSDLAASLPSLRAVVVVPVLGLEPPDLTVGTVLWGDAVGTPAEPVFAATAFEDPLWVVYSSGTTGLPKGLVHGHGGALLMGLVQQGLQYDTGPADRYLWYTSTTWIMWNSLLAALSVGATAILYDGSPLHPTPDRLWELASEHQVTCLGTSPGYLLACEKAGLRPGTEHDLSALTAVGVTGSPLPASSFRWLYDAVSPDLALHVISGGTDFCAALVCDSPWHPVTAGEMACRGLGIDVDSWDADGQSLRDEVGELVVRTPMPSMPLQIWGDEDGNRYHDAYFDVYPGVWRHGDWITITSRATSVVHGRSDSTLNRHGVRMGSADIYSAVEGLPEVAESLVLGVELADGGYWLPLFVRLAPGVSLTEELVARIKARVRDEASPRHVPDEVIEIPAIPHTMTGKKLEVPLKRIIQGVPVEKACNLGGVDDPEAVMWFVRLAEQRART